MDTCCCLVTVATSKLSLVQGFSLKGSLETRIPWACSTWSFRTFLFQALDSFGLVGFPGCWKISLLWVMENGGRLLLVNIRRCISCVIKAKSIDCYHYITIFSGSKVEVLLTGDDSYMCRNLAGCLRKCARVRMLRTRNFRCRSGGAKAWWNESKGAGAETLRLLAWTLRSIAESLGTSVKSKWKTWSATSELTIDIDRWAHPLRGLCTFSQAIATKEWHSHARTPGEYRLVSAHLKLFCTGQLCLLHVRCYLVLASPGIGLHLLYSWKAIWLQLIWVMHSSSLSTFSDCLSSCVPIFPFVCLSPPFVRVYTFSSIMFCFIQSS